MQRLTKLRIVSRVADPHHFKADPDPGFHFNGPDPALDPCSTDPTKAAF